MVNLQNMCTYVTTDLQYYAIPYKFFDESCHWLCQVFKVNEQKPAIHIGGMWYKPNGECLGLRYMNVHRRIYLKDCPLSIQHKIKSWKKSYKEELKNNE